MTIKKSLYIFCFTVLGFLLTLLIHGVVEIVVIKLLLSGVLVFGLAPASPEWFLIHDTAAAGLAVVGPIVGFMQGRYWWRVLYVEGKHTRRFFGRSAR